MPIKKVVRDNLRKAVLWALDTDPERTLPPHRPKAPMDATSNRKVPDLRTPEKVRLVLASTLHLHDSIVDAEAWQGYEGTPEQIENLMWEIRGVLAKNPHFTTPEQVEEVWMEDYSVEKV